MICSAISRVSSAVSAGSSSRVRSCPFTRTRGGAPGLDVEVRAVEVREDVQQPVQVSLVHWA